MHLACHMPAECNIIQEAQLLELVHTAPISHTASSCSPDAVWVSLETKLLVEAHRCKLGERKHSEVAHLHTCCCC